MSIFRRPSSSRRPPRVQVRSVPSLLQARPSTIERAARQRAEIEDLLTPDAVRELDRLDERLVGDALGLPPAIEVPREIPAATPPAGGDPRRPPGGLQRGKPTT